MFGYFVNLVFKGFNWREFLFIIYQLRTKIKRTLKSKRTYVFQSFNFVYEPYKVGVVELLIDPNSLHINI